MSFVKEAFDSLTGQDASRDIKNAANTAATSQTAALDYLKEQEAMPQYYRENALQTLGGLYGFAPPEGSGTATTGMADFYEQLKNDPLYKQLVQEGESSVLRNASATGGLRSGNVNTNLARVNQDALLKTYNQQVSGLSGLAGLPSYAIPISQGIAGVGQTLAQGQIGSAQAKQSAIGQLLSLGGSIGAAAI